jgi:acylphosphatase
MSDVIRHVRVRGRVQGVGYRAFVMRDALRHGVQGWVRNRRDGSVEAVLSGAPDKVDAVVEACRRGPFAARVDALDERQGTADELSLRGSGETFSELPTA